MNSLSKELLGTYFESIVSKYDSNVCNLFASEYSGDVASISLNNGIAYT